MAEYMDIMPKKQVADTSNLVIAPMPGLVKSVSVEEGQAVSHGTASELMVEGVMKELVKWRRGSKSGAGKGENEGEMW